MAKEFYNNQNIKNKGKLNEILRELPPLCREFFQSLENTTSALTRVGYAFDLRLFFNYLASYEYSPFVLERGVRNIKDFSYDDLNSLTISDLRDYISYIECYSVDGGASGERSVNYERMNTENGKKRKIASLRSFFKFLYNMEYIKENIASKLDTPKIHEKPITRLEKNEVMGIIDIVLSGEGLTKAQLARHKKTRLRDAAIIVMFLTTGIRVSELVGLNIEDIDFSSNAFTVTRKGGNTVILYFGDLTKVRLEEYLEERRLLCAYTSSSPLFLSLQGKRITVRAVENLVEKYAALAAPLKHISPHKLRSTYGTMLYNDTNDIYLVAEVLGHKDVNTTKRHYAAISDEARKYAAGALSLFKPGESGHPDKK